MFLVGKNSTLLQVPFLNLMANIQQRAGSVVVRVGGNTQETAQLVASTPDGKILEKDIQGVSNPVRLLLCFSTPLYANSIVDKHATIGVHSRPSLHDEEHLHVCQRPLVPRYTLLYPPLAPKPLIPSRSCRYPILQHYTTSAGHRRGRSSYPR